jgi:A/G-specific adenine glycosylase
MELGALICTPRGPMCLVCPVAPLCRARALGLQDALPVAVAKPPPLAVAEACALVERAGRFLIVQRGPGGLWEGFWEFPTIHLAGADPAGRSFGAAVDLAEGVRRLTGVRVQIGPLAQTVRFGVTRHRVRLDAYRAIGLSDDLTPGPGLARVAWESPEALASYPFGSASRRLASGLSRPGPGGSSD